MGMDNAVNNEARRKGKQRSVPIGINLHKSDISEEI